MACLEDKVIIITGAGSGIGHGVAVYLAQYKPCLVLADIKVDRLEETNQKCQAVGLPKEKILTVSCDVRKEEDLENLVHSAINKFDGIYGLVNNAGVGIHETIESMTMENYDNTMRVNLRGTVYLSKLCISHLKKSKGSVVNMSSVLGQSGFCLLPTYSMTKAAIDQFTHLFAAEMAPHLVRVNSISPGFIRSEFRINSGIPETQDEQTKRGEGNPMGRIGEPEDIGKLVKFLLSDDSSYITGEVIRVDGGSCNRVRPFEKSHMKLLEKANKMAKTS